MNLYADNDDKCAEWLRRLIQSNVIPAGLIYKGDICGMRPKDTQGHTQCHFFAGIGGWAEALRIAGWPADRPVWTGSCPCQPFSCAGKGLGTADKRHLWPEFARLIRECHPPVVFGEQVASKAGREWLAGVRADLEAMGYAVGAADLCAAGVGAPHIRQRLYWCGVANTKGVGRSICDPKDVRETNASGDTLADPGDSPVDGCGPGAGRVADATDCGTGRPGSSKPSGNRKNNRISRPDGREACGLGDPESGGLGIGGDASQPGSCGHTVSAGGAGLGGVANAADGDGRSRERGEKTGTWTHGERGRGFAGGGASHWFDSIWHQCRDGKTRRIPVEPALFPLAHGIPGRVGLLRGAGNAIVPQVAAEFIASIVEMGIS